MAHMGRDFRHVITLELLIWSLSRLKTNRRHLVYANRKYCNLIGREQLLMRCTAL